MSTIFEFGNAQFVKDLVFGWHFRPNDVHKWVKLTEFPTEALKELEHATFPSYVPDDLKKTILSELERRQVQEQQARECGIVVADAWKKYDERLTTAEATVSRQNDRIKLIESIISNMEADSDSVSADLEYVKINRVGDKWIIRGTRDIEPECFMSIGEAVDRILARWW